MKGYPRIDEIAAAWAFCGMLALGAFFGEIGDARDDPSLTAYGGVHLPGAREARVLGGEPDEGRGDGQTTKSPNYTAPVSTVAAKLPAGELPRAPTRDGRSCWYMLRQSRSG
jgi:hypothetical protein